MSTPASAPSASLEPRSERQDIAAEIQTAVRHTAVYGLGNALAKFIGFLMIPFYTHYLNPVDYGILEILDLSMSLLGMFLAMGMTAAMLRCYAAADSDEAQRGVVGSAFLFAAVTGLIVFGLAFRAIPAVSAMIFGPKTPPVYLLTAFASFIIGYIVNVPRTYLRAREASGWFVGVETATLLLMLVLNIVFIAVLRIGLMGILCSSIVAAGLQLIVLTGWMLRRVPMRYSSPALHRMLAFGLPLMFSNMAVFTLNFADRFFLQHLRSLDVVGIYAVGYKFAFMLNFLLVQPFYTMWQSRMYVAHKNPRHGLIFRQMCILYSVLLISAGLTLAVFSPEIVHLMVGPQFADCQEVIPVVALAYVFYGLGYFAETGMLLRDRTKLVGLLGACAAILNLGLNYFLISWFGMMGAAWATLLSFAALALGSYILSESVYPLHLGVERVLAALGLGIALYWVSRAAPQPLAVALVAKVALCVAFPLLLWKMRVLSEAETATIIAARDQAWSWVAARWHSVRVGRPHGEAWR
jgi:O-antigen/teichoic acid export membrane protein